MTDYRELIEREIENRKQLIKESPEKNEKESDLLFWHKQFYFSFRKRMGYSRAANLAFNEIVTIIKSFERLKADVEKSGD